MRQLTNLLAASIPPSLVVMAADESGFGSSCHKYEISGYTTDGPSADSQGPGKTTILFQNGPCVNGMPNGVTIQSLLVVIGKRLEETTPMIDGMPVMPMGVMENLSKAIGVLDARDQRLRRQAVAESTFSRVPAHS